MLRKYAIRLILWLCNRFDFYPVDETRYNLEGDAKARGERWEQFAREEGGLFDMIEALRKEAFETFSDLPPDAHEQQKYVAMSDRNLRRLKQRIQSIIATGKIEATRDAQRVDMRIVKSA